MIVISERKNIYMDKTPFCASHEWYCKLFRRMHQFQLVYIVSKVDVVSGKQENKPRKTLFCQQMFSYVTHDSRNFSMRFGYHKTIDFWLCGGKKRHSPFQNGVPLSKSACIEWIWEELHRLVFFLIEHDWNCIRPTMIPPRKQQATFPIFSLPQTNPQDFCIEFFDCQQMRQTHKGMICCPTEKFELAKTQWDFPICHFCSVWHLNCQCERFPSHPF